MISYLRKKSSYLTNAENTREPGWFRQNRSREGCIGKVQGGREDVRVGWVLSGALESI